MRMKKQLEFELKAMLEPASILPSFAPFPHDTALNWHIRKCEWPGAQLAEAPGHLRQRGLTAASSASLNPHYYLETESALPPSLCLVICSSQSKHSFKINNDMQGTYETRRVHWWRAPLWWNTAYEYWRTFCQCHPDRPEIERGNANEILG